MALTKEVVIDQITVTDNGVIQLREVTRVLEDGVVLSEQYHRSSLEPGQDVSAQPDNVQAICAAAWTTEVVAAYQAARAAAADAQP